MCFAVCVQIENISHKALRNFAEHGSAKGLPGDLVGRIANMLSFLAGASGVEELLISPNFGAHMLTGDYAGVWSLTVTRSWRMTFRLDDNSAIIDLDLEEYH